MAISNRPVVVLTTFNREEVFKKTLNSINRDQVDIIVIQDSIKEFPYSNETFDIIKEKAVHFGFKENVGIGAVKKKGIELAQKIYGGLQHLFIIEDDIEILSNDVWEVCINFSEDNKLCHFNWNDYPDAKKLGVYDIRKKTLVDIQENYLEAYDEHLVLITRDAKGSFSYFNKEALDNFEIDLGYKNALEHVDIEIQLIQKNLLPPFWNFCCPAILSQYLQDNGEESTITGKNKYEENLYNSAHYWETKWGVKVGNIPNKGLNNSLRWLRNKNKRKQYKYPQNLHNREGAVSIICAIKDRCMVRYEHQDQLTPHEKVIMGQHDGLIKSVEGHNQGRVKTNQELLSDPKGFRLFDNFLKSINKQSHLYEKAVELVVVDYSSKDDEVEEVVQDLWDFGYQIVKLPHDEKFNRGKALDLGIQKTTHKNLHITDVDMTYHSPRFLEECGSLDPQTAIFPIIAKQQTPSSLTLYMEIAGFGIASLPKALYDQSEGFISKESWGEEDVKLAKSVEKLIGTGKVKRTMYPEAVHQFHSSLNR